MRGLWLSVVGTAMSLLLLVGLMACDEDGRRVTLEVTEMLGQEFGTRLDEQNHGEERGHLSRAVVEASDPRLSGTWTVLENCRWSVRAGYEEVEELCVGSVRVENEGGTWLGRHEGYRREGIGNLDPVVLEGQGGYAGLTAVLDYAQDDVTGPYKGVAGFGFIVDFEMPEPPEPPEPPAE
jgi:hypothetical protein